ncbi:hypothetical protein [Streptomyces violaceorubidus]|uniref:Uncharacterized protein n=1 Tax=Streptomyces violaceorubidus TaxID=284042 RepID=A0ABV1SZ32_9ACTN
MKGDRWTRRRVVGLLARTAAALPTTAACDSTEEAQEPPTTPTASRAGSGTPGKEPEASGPDPDGRAE